MNESKAARYQRRQRRNVVAVWVAVTAGLTALALTPFGAILHAVATRMAGRLPADTRATAASVLFIAMAAATCGLAATLVAWRQGRWANSAAGDDLSSSWRAQALAVLVLVPVVVIAGLLVQTVAQLAGGAWWLAATILLSAILAAALRIGPRLLGVGGAIRPVSRPGLAERISGLASRAGVPVASVGEWRVSEPASIVARVAGTGRRRQILLAADVVGDWTDDEVLVVVAHELAHLAHGDLVWSSVVNAGVLGGGLLASDLVMRSLGPWLGLTGAADARALPLIALSALGVWLLATPLRHAQSRHQERRADRFALALTGQAEAFATAVRRAGARRLVDDRPTRMTNWLFHRHPPIAERLALAERFRQEDAAGDETASTS